MMFLPIIIFIIFLLLLLYVFLYRFNILVINYMYLIKFLFFNVILFIYYIIYLIIYNIFFIFKNYRFFSYYYLNIGTAFYYFNKKSIYFLFWRYLVIYLISTVLFFFSFSINYFFNFIKKLLQINNVYLYLFIYLKIKYINISKTVLINLYNYIIAWVYYFFNFINIDEMYLWFTILELNIFNVLKYKVDPIGNRNSILTWSSNVYHLYYKYISINLFSIHFFNFEYKYIFKKFYNSIITYFIFLIHLNFNYNNEIFIKKWLSNIYLSNKIYIKKSGFFNILQFLLYSINLFVVNIIYIFCIFCIYFIYSIFLFFKEFKYIILYILLFLFCIKYYWIIYYYFFILYKHYTFNLPLFEVKESTRFFNFEYIDLRNYFNIIFLHNTLIDLSVFNNVIYNDLLNNLNKTLSVYGFKINSQYDLNLYALLDVRNKDTKLINDLLGTYNNNQSYSLLKWYMSLKKSLSNKVAQNIFKFSKKSYKDHRFYRKTFEKSMPITGLENKEDSFINLKSEYLFHLGHKENYIIWKFFNKGYFKKNILKSTVSLKSTQFIKINQIPLKYIHLYHSDNYKILDAIWSDRFGVIHHAIQKHASYFIEWFKKWAKEENYYFYFNNIYDFDNYKENLTMKHKIPTFQWTSVRWRRKLPNTSYFNATAVSMYLDEQQSWYTFYEIARKKLKKKRMFKIFYMDYQYPFSMLKKKHIFNVLNHDSNINFKIIKKYYFLKSAKIYSMKRYYKKLLYSENLLVRLFFYRLNHWDNPFIKNYLSSKSKNKSDSFNYNFWFFFDYLKTDKYYYSKYNEFYKNEESDVNLYFIKRIRKDYIKLRNNLLRLYSLYFHYYILEAANYKHLFYNSSLPANLKNERLIWSYDNFKISWILKIYLTKERTNIELFKNISFLSLLFKSRFFAYFVYCDYTINSYNDLYYIKNKSYRLRVLNKINNLKRFFYFQNKHINGWSILKYINSFSLSYHIKHFLWHSPYSFLLFKDTFIVHENNIINTGNFVSSYNLKLKTNRNIIFINSINYIMLFNLFLNVIEINNNWFYILNYKHVNIESNIELLNLYNKVFYKTYYNYYYNGYFMISTPFYFIDIYRFSMNFLFEYYNNFLYKLTRYRYILNYKNYTFIEFVKRYFYKWYDQIYPRIRTQLYRYLAYSKFFRWIWSSKLGFKAINVYGFRAYRKGFIPFWFLYDYYIKLFIFYLLEKYYTKKFFIYYWLNWFNNYLFYNYYLILLFLYFFNFKYFLFKYFLCYFNTLNFNILNMFNFLFNIKHIYLWYISIMFKFDIDIFYNFNYIKGYLILKWFFLIMNKAIFNIFDINFNKFILIKFYIEKLINYYCNIIFNIKNALVYFKPNYYYYNKQRSSRNFHKTKILNTVFKNTITYRNIYSFNHLTYNITFFKNIYLSNIYNYIYFMNTYNLNINNIFNSFFYIFKYNYMYFIILIYLLFYWFIMLMLYLYYKKFYNIFFFTYSVNVDSQYNWEKIFNDKATAMSYLYNNKKYLIYKKIWLNKKNHNFYNFYFFNTFINKLSIYKMVLYKTLFLNNKYNNFKNLNNNEIIEMSADAKINIWPSIRFSYYLNFFKQFTIMPFKLKKEGILYNFSFLNFFNNNLFNFCFFYWIILIPYFFFEYVLVKYYLKGHVLIKHKVIVILKILLDNFKLYINLFKYLGDGINVIYKHRFPKTYNGVSVLKKKKYYGYFFKWDRYTQFHIRVSPLGNYYYWFFKINKLEYLLSLKNYFFNFSYNSVYFYYIYIYIFFLIIIMRKYRNKILLLKKAETANIKNKIK